MKVECPKCSSKYNIYESKIPENGAVVRCKKCSKKFKIKKSVTYSANSTLQQSDIQSNSKIQKTLPETDSIICPICQKEQPVSTECIIAE